jgi:predicted AlkP superfamily phosphohydrolase/phosphomutase
MPRTSFPALKLREALSWVALATLFAGVLVGVPRRSVEPGGAALEFQSSATKHPRLVVLGIDGLDPEILAETIAKHPERMRNFAQLAREQGIHPLGTSTPPQSPVAWSNFITGRDPGGHGIYDFLHRDPTTRMPTGSTTVQEHGTKIPLWSDWKFELPGELNSNRSGDAFWTLLERNGVAADIWRMPANFPVVKSKGWSFSGMMTPAMDSAYGMSTVYTTDPSVSAVDGEARVLAVREFDGVIDTLIPGPPNALKEGDPATSAPLRITLDRDANAAILSASGRVLVLEPGEWSDFISVKFEMPLMGMMDVYGIVRFYVRSIDEGRVEIYSSPVNIDPAAPAMSVSEPSDASAEVADLEHGIGPFYTQGMPEDVNALKAGVVSVEEFMQQAHLVQSEGERMLEFALERYMANPDGGFLFFYFSGVDLCGHMMWRHSDAEHPHHEPEIASRDSSWWSKRSGSTWKDVIADLYMEMDPVLGRVRAAIGGDAALIVMSDHGFAPYRRRVSLNTWLLENGYLVLKDGVAKEKPEDDPAHDTVAIYTGDGKVDWSKTRAYGVGFNGLYLNLKGRELDDPSTLDDEAGIVDPKEAEALLREIKAKLEALRDPTNGKQVVLRADLAIDVYAAERRAEAPDILVGYNSDYDNSDEASLGRIPDYVLSDNDRGGTFNGSHLMAPDVVAGTLMSNRKVAGGAHKLEDLTVEVLRHYGIAPGPGMKGHPVLE